MAPTLATKSQKPRPERWPLTDPSPPCAAPPRSQRADNGLLPASVQPANGRQLVAELLLAFEAAKETAASRPSDGQRARLPHSKALGSNRRSCALKRGTYLQLLAFKSLQPWPHTRSKSLQPSAPRRPEQLRTRRPLAKPKRAKPFQSSAVKLGLKPAQLQLSRGKRFCDSTRSSCSARLALAIKSLRPLPDSAACLRRNCHSRRPLAGLREPQAAASQAPTSP